MNQILFRTQSPSYPPINSGQVLEIIPTAWRANLAQTS